MSSLKSIKEIKNIYKIYKFFVFRYHKKKYKEKMFKDFFFCKVQENIFFNNLSFFLLIFSWTTKRKKK